MFNIFMIPLKGTDQLNLQKCFYLGCHEETDKNYHPSFFSHIIAFLALSNLIHILCYQYKNDQNVTKSYLQVTVGDSNLTFGFLYQNYQLRRAT